MKKLAYGFTIVELLIVIVVIAILATISVVAYNGVQNRANNTAIISDLGAMKKQVMLFHASEGIYPTSSQYFNGTGGMVRPSISKSSYSTALYNYYYCTDVGVNSNFGIAIRSTSGQTYTISSTSDVVTIAGVPSWTSSCGAFGETVLANVQFGYGYHFGNGAWQYGL